MSSPRHQGKRDDTGPASGDTAALRKHVADLEAEVARLRAAEETSRRREQQLTTHNLVLVNLSRSSAIEEGDVQIAFQQITVAAAHTLEVERASIWLFTADRSAIKCIDLYQRTPDRHSDGLQLRAADFPSYFRAIEDNRTLAADDARTDPRTREFDATYLAPLGITSMLDAPVRRGGKLVGVICHEHVGPPRRWTLEDQAFAGSMADFVAMTMQARERAEALRVAAASEKQLRQIIELVPHMILAKDGRGHILLANKAVAEAYGSSVEQLIGRNHWDVHPSRDEAAGMLSDDLQVIETGRGRFIAEERFTDSRGQQRILQTAKIPFMYVMSREPAVLGVSIDITQQKQDQQQRENMIQELDHRVKNNLAVVMAITEQTARGSSSVETFTDALAGRLRAIAITHEMLACAQWDGADLRGMAERLFQPFQSPGQSRVIIEGESLRLPASLAPSMCMILHELATNAAKHGALSNPRGRVDVSWQREMRPDGERRIPWLVLEWIERNGPPVKRPQHTGFGTRFIRDTTQYQLHGQALLEFDAKGLRCALEIPLERLTRRAQTDAAIESGGDDRAGQAESARAEAVPAGAGGGARRVLVVEDDLLVAQSLASHLRSLGCEVIGPASNCEDACALVKSEPVDAAILDVNLSSGTCAQVARVLAGRKTPFTYVTGYSNLKSLPDDLRGQRVLCKPVDRETLDKALREMAGA